MANLVSVLLGPFICSGIPNGILHNIDLPYSLGPSSLCQVLRCPRVFMTLRSLVRDFVGSCTIGIPVGLSKAHTGAASERSLKLRAFSSHCIHGHIVNMIHSHQALTLVSGLDLGQWLCPGCQSSLL